MLLGNKITAQILMSDVYFFVNPLLICPDCVIFSRREVQILILSKEFFFENKTHVILTIFIGKSIVQ